MSELATTKDVVSRKGHPARKGHAGVVRSYMYMAFDYADALGRPDLLREMADAIMEELQMRGTVIVRHDR